MSHNRHSIMKNLLFRWVHLLPQKSCDKNHIPRDTRFCCNEWHPKRSKPVKNEDGWSHYTVKVEVTHSDVIRVQKIQFLLKKNFKKNLNKKFANKMGIQTPLKIKIKGNYIGSVLWPKKFLLLIIYRLWFFKVCKYIMPHKRLFIRLETPGPHIIQAAALF